jgi:hypothetical protein
MDHTDDYAESDHRSPCGPPRGAALGVLAFLASWAVGIGITILIVRSIPPKVGHPTEAYEGFDDFVTSVFWFAIGVGVSFAVALVVGVVVSSRISSRQMLGRADRR